MRGKKCGVRDTERGERNGACGINAFNSECRIPNSACGSVKKHPCPDCRFCQWCSEERCQLCLNRKVVVKKLSLQEQIELYEAINKEKKGD